MDPDLTGARWFKSSASNAGGCVEVAHLAEGAVAVRDSKDTARRPMSSDRHEWECFLIGAKKGERSTFRPARPDVHALAHGHGWGEYGGSRRNGGTHRLLVRLVEVPVSRTADDAVHSAEVKTSAGPCRLPECARRPGHPAGTPSRHEFHSREPLRPLLIHLIPCSSAAGIPLWTMLMCLTPVRR